MLKSLFIRNFVLIDRLDITFEDGFSVITGETGAGKSIILGALSLVLGDRADTKSIQAGSDKCLIEAAFDISSYKLKDFFARNDLEYDEKECLLRRELYSSGKSRAFVNDSPVQLAVLKQLGNMLIDVHSQHQNLLLADSHFQLNVVDLMSHTEKLLSAYQKEYSNYVSLTQALNDLKNRAQRTKDEEDYIRFQYEELDAAKLQSDEQDVLEKELETLSHTEEIKSALYRVNDLLSGENMSVVSSLKEALSLVDQLSEYYPKASDYSARLRSSYIDMEDLASETDVLKDDVEFDPKRLEQVNDRLNLIYTLQQKHKTTSVAELIAKRDEFASQLDAIDSFDEELNDLTKKQQLSYKQLVEQAKDITSLRKNTSKLIESQIVERLIQLGMPNARFQISFKEKETPAADGMDEISFLFSANKNEILKPVSQTASGGEISRLMLCVKAMISGYTALPSIIFDEIDTGVSGEIADKMAGIMYGLGQKMQVLAITHLPQIAAKGKEHYFVYKEDTDNRTLTRIRHLNENERVNEIARMLSGAKMTNAAIENAKSLLGM